MIRKEAYVHKSVMGELSRIIEDSEVMDEDDNQIALDVRSCHRGRAHRAR